MKIPNDTKVYFQDVKDETRTKGRVNKNNKSEDIKKTIFCGNSFSPWTESKKNTCWERC